MGFEQSLRVCDARSWHCIGSLLGTSHAVTQDPWETRKSEIKQFRQPEKRERDFLVCTYESSFAALCRAMLLLSCSTLAHARLTAHGPKLGLKRMEGSGGPGCSPGSGTLCPDPLPWNPLPAPKWAWELGLCKIHSLTGNKKRRNYTSLVFLTPFAGSGGADQKESNLSCCPLSQLALHTSKVYFWHHDGPSRHLSATGTGGCTHNPAPASPQA